MLKMVIFVINALPMMFMLLLISGVVSFLLIVAGLIVFLIPSKKPQKPAAITLSQALGIVPPITPQQPQQIMPPSTPTPDPVIGDPTRTPLPPMPPLAPAAPTSSDPSDQPDNTEQIQQLVTNHEMLLTLIDGIQKIGNSRKDEQIVKTAKTLVQTIENFAGEQSWLAIKPYIETLYPDFFKKLNSASSEALSDFEIRTCLLSVFDIPSKKIAQITNRSVRTIETTVYKIRKKMSIPTEIRLSDFLINI